MERDVIEIWNLIETNLSSLLDKLQMECLEDQIYNDITTNNLEDDLLSCQSKLMAHLEANMNIHQKDLEAIKQDVGTQMKINSEKKSTHQIILQTNQNMKAKLERLKQKENIINETRDILLTYKILTPNTELMFDTSYIEGCIIGNTCESFKYNPKKKTSVEIANNLWDLVEKTNTGGKDT